MVNVSEIDSAYLVRSSADIDLSQYIHVLIDDGPKNRVRGITADDDEAEEAICKGIRVLNHQPATVIFLVLKGRLPWELMADSTWRAVVAPNLKAAGERYQKSQYDSALWDAIPPDLPAPFADKRLQLLVAEYLPEDLLSILELTEIVMALQSGRDIDLCLFRDKSRAMSWHRGVASDEEGLQLAMQSNLELQDKYFSLQDASSEPLQKRFARRMCDRLEAEQRELVISMVRVSA